MIALALSLVSGFLPQVARARALLTGPVMGAIAMAAALASIAIGIAWIRADVRKVEVAKCEASRIADELAAAKVREESLQSALRVRIAESRRLEGQAAMADAEIRTLTAERDAAREASARAVGARSCLPADDPWLRNATAPAAKGGAGRR